MIGIERFDSKIFKAGGCWLWTSSLHISDDFKGYGRYWVNGRQVYAHRFAYEMLIGPIPDGFEIDHLCRRRCCVNPEHLETVTSAENTRRGLVAQLRQEATHCKNGHEFTPENTLVYDHKNNRRGYIRICRACRDRRGRERYMRLKHGQ